MTSDLKVVVSSAFYDAIDWLKDCKIQGLISFQFETSLMLWLLSPSKCWGRFRPFRQKVGSYILQILIKVGDYISDSTGKEMEKEAVKKLNSTGGEDLRYVVHGHSHYPLIKSCALKNGDIGLYLNSGTWRTVIGPVDHKLCGTSNFHTRQEMTFLIFYKENEREDNYRYETWQGTRGL